MAAMRFITWVFLFLFAGPEAIEASKLFEAPVFIFGDSTVDVGTNNFLPVSQEIKANFLYNGIDYPYSDPTGRFSNGYNIADQIVRLLSYNKRSPPAFLSLVNHTSSFKRKILQGVNFASGGSGILDGTGAGYNNTMSLGKQIQQFVTVHSNITELRGPEETADMLSKSLFLISVGSNDILDFLHYNGRHSPPDFLTAIRSTYHDHLKSLYDLGARKFGIISVPPIGCCPLLRHFNLSGGCLEEANAYAQSFYNATEDILNQLSLELPGMTYSLGNLYVMTTLVIEDQYAFGLKNTDTPCCGSAIYQCNQTASLCSNRDEYLFWDWVHPTQFASRLVALTLYGGSTRFVAPMNFSRLAGVDV